MWYVKWIGSLVIASILIINFIDCGMVFIKWFMTSDTAARFLLMGICGSITLGMYMKNNSERNCFMLILVMSVMAGSYLGIEQVLRFWLITISICLIVSYHAMTFLTESKINCYK